MTAWAVGGGSGVSTAGTSSGGAGGGTASHNFGVGYIMYLATYGDFVVFSSLPNELITFADIESIKFNRLPEVTRHDKIMNGWLYGNFALTNPASVLLADASGVYTRFPKVLGIDGAGSPLKGAQVAGDGFDAVDFGTLGAGFGNAAAIDNGGIVADAFMRTFGDAGGKWNDLLSAMSNSKTEADRIIVNKKGGASGTGSSRGPNSSDEGSGGSYEVETNAGAITPEESAVAWLSISEVQEQFKHYIAWWKLVFDSLNGGSYYSEYDMAKVEEAFNTVITTATQYVNASGPGSAEEIKNTREFQDFAYGYASALLKYPAVGLNTICMRKLTGEVSTRAMTWEGALGGARTLSAGGESGRVYLDEYNKLDFPMRNNRGQLNMRAAGCIFTNTFFQTNQQAGIDDVLPVSHGLDAHAGYVFYGFYGMLPLISSTTITTTTPPPDDPTPPPPTTVPTTDDLGTYYLMDYELNHVFDSMAEHYTDSTSHDHARLNTGISTTDPSDYSDCGHGHNDYNTTTYDEVTYHEDEGSGKSVDMDNAGPTKLFLHNNGVKGNTWWTRDEAKAGPSISSSSVGDYVIDYGFNLLRRHFDDAKAYSKIIAQDVSKEYLEQTLGMYEAIMVNDTVKKIATLRDSTAIVGDATGIRDDLGWYANFTRTGSSVKYKTYANSHTYSCGRHCTAICHYNSSMADGSIAAFSVHGGTAHEYSVGLVSIAHKYQTAPMPTGYARPQDTVPFDYRPTTDGEGSNDDEQYRGSNTIDPGTEVTYVPEVPMLADEVPGPELEHHPKKVTTVGEEARKSKLILMTLYRVTGASNPVKGVVYSDTAVGGDAGLSSQTRSGRLALTAGGDFTVKADTNMQVNLYGYALDLIEPGDAGYDTVTLGNDVKAGWGNSGSRTALMNKYQEWAAAMLNPKNYQADFEMAIGTKEYNSFSATVGSFSSKASQSTETGQYNIHVKHGKIEDDAGYRAFISQLASDYGCSEGEAETLFTNSDMASAIIKAIEHDNSSANKSLPAKYVLAPGEIGTFNEPDLSSMLGNASHWYDEEVRVFVIRRFMTPAAKVTNIIAQDKMDIGNSMEVLGGDKMGHFKLNVWFRNSCYTRAVQEYIPNTNGDNKAQAISAGDLIIAGVDVNGADFNITNATTATGKH